MRTKGELAEREKQREFYRPMIRQIFLALRKLCLEICKDIELDNFDRRVQRHTQEGLLDPVPRYVWKFC